MLEQVSVKELPSYRIAAVEGAVEKTRNVSAAAKGIGDRLLSWAQELDVTRDAVPGIKGLSVMHADWARFAEETNNFSPETATVAAYDSPSMIEGLLIDQGPIEAEALQGRFGGQGQAKEFGVSIRYSPGGLYAVARHQGSYSTIRQALHTIFEWLDRSDYQLFDGPVVDLYLNDSAETAEDELLTDVCVPIVRYPDAPRAVFEFH